MRINHSPLSGRRAALGANAAEEARLAYDILADEVLHREGAELLKSYDCIISGTHPEYTSQAMSDAMLAYLEQGGRFIYLGGNGFYWRFA